MFPALAVSYYSNRKGLKAELGSDRLLGVPLETYIPSEKLAIGSGSADENIEIMKAYMCKQRGIGGGYRMEKEFDVEIKEVLSRVQRVKAESLDDAINKAMDMYYSEKIVLGSKDMKGVDFAPISEEQLPSSLPEENKKEIGGKIR